LFSTLGPEVIAGAPDDDPSGIATYSISGAALAMFILWSNFRLAKAKSRQARPRQDG
jgi:Mn2+/Fe2+ NRAMP family transporter